MMRLVMRLVMHPVLRLIMLWVLLWQASVPVRAASDIDCLVVEQEDFSAGKFKVYLARDAVRIEALRGRGTVVARAPDWRVTVFNQDGDKMEMSLNTWRNIGLGSVVADLRPLFAQGEGRRRGPFATTVMGRPAVKFDQRVKLDNDMLVVGHSSPDSKSLDWTVHAVFGKEDVGPAARDIYYGLLKTPPLGVPLYSFGRSSGALGRWTYRTHKVYRKTVPMTLFDVPAGLKKAPTINKVIYGSSTADLLMQMTESHDLKK